MEEAFKSLRDSKVNDDFLKRELIRKVRSYNHIPAGLDNLLDLKVTVNGKSYIMRNETKGTVGKVAQAAGVALPPSVRRC